MDRMAVTELGYVGFGVRDLNAWRVFPGEVFGMEVLDTEDGVRLRTDWHHRIILERGKDDDLRFPVLMDRVRHGNDRIFLLRAHPFRVAPRIWVGRGPVGRPVGTQRRGRQRGQKLVMASLAG